ncbi:SDR family NAD(P)-dependent oxidoreductase [Chachezhania sediminis]|uniref:SDR family NAD(P)-dependent oxidoreductase n=1 Tax=Chachezhania sediminis TaxID=2599291 RepID=UPI00131C7915|nr:SDR family oxidoreductase [Chachezhania sediminis]
MGRLDGKTALVTGAGRGIGRALALRLAAEGAQLVLNDLDTDPLEEVAAAAVDTGARVVTQPGSVVEDGFAEDFVALALAEFGALDIIVNNAGYTWYGTCATTTDQQMETMVALHMMAPFRLLRAAIGPIRAFADTERAEGREVLRKVVNISSLAGTGGVAGQFAYSAAKAGLVGMTQTLCKDWGRYKVNVNAVAFGLIDTRLNRVVEGNAPPLQFDGRDVPIGISEGFREATERMIPLGRIGTPEEAAAGALFFCSPDSDYVSGQVLHVAGGLVN